MTKDKSNGITVLKPKDKAVETYQATKIFEQYYALGEQRSIQQVAKVTGANYNTVVNYSRKYFWQDRVMARDYKHAMALQHQTSTSIQEEKDMIVNAIRRTVRRKFVADEGGGLYLDIKLNDIYSLERAVKLMMLLLGEATDISMVRVEYVEVVINTIIHIIKDKLDDDDLIGDITVALREINLGPDVTLATT